MWLRLSNINLTEQVVLEVGPFLDFDSVHCLDNVFSGVVKKRRSVGAYPLRVLRLVDLTGICLHPSDYGNLGGVPNLHFYSRLHQILDTFLNFTRKFAVQRFTRNVGLGPYKLYTPTGSRYTDSTEYDV